MSFEDMKSALKTNVSMDKKSTIEVKTIMRSYRIDMDLAEALNTSDINKNKLVNTAIRCELVKRGLL